MSVTTDPGLHERAALDVLARLPEWWRVGPVTYNPGDGRWSVTARGPNGRRLRPPETVHGCGEDEIAAMIDLRIRLDERHSAEELEEIERRGRAAFLEGAEERSRTVEGRPLSVDE